MPAFSKCVVGRHLNPTRHHQAGSWGEYDGKRAPVGRGCLKHVYTCMFGYPDMTMEEASQKYHERSEAGKEFKKDLDNSAVLMERLIPRLPPLMPASEVAFGRLFSVESYYECAFVTEAELVQLFGLSSRALKMPKPSNLQLEDGSGSLAGWHIGLHGIPPEIACALRKVRVSSALNLHHADFLMTKDVQIRANQAATTLQVALRQNVEKRASAERCVGRLHLTSYQTLSSKASDIKEAWDFFHPSCQAEVVDRSCIILYNIIYIPSLTVIVTVIVL